MTASEDARGDRPGGGRREPPVLPLVMDAQERGRTKLGVGGMLEFFYVVCRLRFVRGLPVRRAGRRG